MTRKLLALSFVAAALAPACSEPEPVSAAPTFKDVEVGDDSATQEWIGGLPEGWRAVLTAVQATAAAYDFIADTPTKTLQSPEGLKDAGDRVEFARDAVRRLESFGVQPPNGIALGYREYFVTSGPFNPGRRYYSKLLSESDLSKFGFKVIVRFDESLCFSNQGMISDSLSLYANRDGAIEFFSTRRRLVARTKGFLGGRRSMLACIEFFDPFRKIATPATTTSPAAGGSIEDLIRDVNR